MKTITSGGWVAWIAPFACGFSASIQAADTPNDARYETALNEMLGDIADPERSFAFVKAATDAGDLRGAVAALERMLLLNPSLANIQLELGVLYLRLGNESMGRYHINRALQAPNVPRVVRERALALLAEPNATAAGQSFFRGQLALAGHYDSNANAAPASPDVFGHNPFTDQDLIFQLSPDSLEQSDSYADLSLGLSHSYVFGGTGNTLETNGLLYGSKYNDFSNLDFAIASLDIGPVLRIGGAADAPIGLRPYAAATYDLLDGDHYLSAYGGGLELRAQSGARTYSFVKVEYAHQDFYDTAERFVSDRSGKYTTANAGLVHQFGAAIQVSADIEAGKADADTSYQSYDRLGGGVGAKFFFGYGRTLPPWAVGVSARVRKSDYDSPDPQVNTVVTRDDKRYDANLTLDIPLSRSVLLSVRGTYTDNNSNIPNYEFDNTGGSVGASWRF